MPYKFEKKIIPAQHDRRRKLTDAQKAEIEHRYKAGGVSARQLATEYGVSKKLILLIVNPEAKAKNDQYIKEHWSDYYDKDKHRDAVRAMRAHKKDLDERGLLLTSSDGTGFRTDAIQSAQGDSMNIPNYLKDEPIRCTRPDKVRELANGFLALQRYKRDLIHVVTTKNVRGVPTSKDHIYNLYDDLDGKSPKSRSKIIEMAAEICGNRKQFIKIYVYPHVGESKFTVHF
jgi:hypothetical protein